MGRLFYKKPTAIMTIALTIVLVFLVCLLLIVLTQYTTLKSRKAELLELISQAQEDDAAKEKLIEYRKTNDYVIEWALKLGWIKAEDVNWIKENT